MIKKLAEKIIKSFKFKVNLKFYQNNNNNKYFYYNKK